MSGKLVGLVIAGAPLDDPALWSVLVVVGEEMRRPDDHAIFDMPELARRARLSVSTARRAVARGDRDAWLYVKRGRGQGVASTYWLNVERLSTIAALTGHSDRESENVNRSSRPGKGGLTGQTGVLTGHSDRVPVSRTNPVPPGEVRDELDVAMLLPFEGGRGDDESNGNGANGADYWGVVLADVPPTARPTRPAVMAEIRTLATRNGWTAAELADALRADDHDFSRSRGGVVVEALRRIAARPVKRRPTLPPKCGLCDANRMREDDNGLPYRCPDCGTPTRGNAVDDDAPRREKRNERAEPAPLDTHALAADLAARMFGRTGT